MRWELRGDIFTGPGNYYFLLGRGKATLIVPVDGHGRFTLFAPWYHFRQRALLFAYAHRIG